MKIRLTAAAGALLVAALSACGSSGDTASNTPSVKATGAGASATGADSGTWPRTVANDAGNTEIKTQPKRIVSTSVVLTGSLLAVDAPVVGSGASSPGAPGFDDQGFFAHWSDEAKAKGVKPLYTKSELNLEAVIAAKPDLIVMSTSGGDSTKQQLDQLKAIAPVVSINYNSLPWQKVTELVGEASGHDAQAKAAVDKYTQDVAALKGTVRTPAEPVQMIVFNESNGSSFALPGGPHDLILQDLGIKLAPVTVKNAQAMEGGNRKDFVFPTEEASVKALTSNNVLLVDGTQDTVKQIKAHPAYKTIPAATTGRLIPLGSSSFKLDYFSATQMANTVAAAFKA